MNEKRRFRSVVLGVAVAGAALFGLAEPAAAHGRGHDGHHKPSYGYVWHSPSRWFKPPWYRPPVFTPPPFHKPPFHHPHPGGHHGGYKNKPKHIRFTNPRPKPKQIIVVVATGCWIGETVTVKVGGITIKVVTCSGRSGRSAFANVGEARFEFEAPEAFGSYTLVAEGAQTGVFAESDFEVVDPARVAAPARAVPLAIGSEVSEDGDLLPVAGVAAGSLAIAVGTLTAGIRRRKLPSIAT